MISKISFALLRPSNAIIIAIALGVLLRRFGYRRLGGVFFVLGFASLVAAGWTGLSAVLLNPLELRFPQVALTAETKAPTGIIILGGALDTGTTAVWGSTQLIDGAERIVAAAELAKRFPTSKIIYSGGHLDVVEGERSEALLARPLLESFGISKERILLETSSRNTRENATLSFDAVSPKAGENWWLVTSAFHMPRAMGTFRAAGWEGLTAYPVDFRGTPGAAVIGRQFASEGLFLTDLAVKEWMGLTAYYLAGYTDAWLPAP